MPCCSATDAWYIRLNQKRHEENLPLQLGRAPTKPEDADHLTWDTKEGDLVVLATDGLFDNVDPEGVNRRVSQVIFGAKRTSVSYSTQIGLDVGA